MPEPPSDRAKDRMIPSEPDHPKNLRKRKFWRGVYGAFRVLKPVAALLGPQYRRSRDWIEIDITYACNLSCYNCNRSVRQAPSGEHVTLEQIERFIRESVEKGLRWRRIRLIGGEPTVHPQLLDFVRVLLEYKRLHSPKMLLAIHTNGYGDKVESVLARLPGEVKIVNTSKTGIENPFYPFNLAPRDSISHHFVDYSMGCRVPEQCGTGLTPFGYYPCAIAGGIDRVLGLDIGRKRLPHKKDRMAEELRELCQWCGNFRRGGFNKWSDTVDREVMSRSWKEVYKRYRQRRPKLTRD